MTLMVGLGQIQQKMWLGVAAAVFLSPTLTVGGWAIYAVVSTRVASN